MMHPFQRAEIEAIQYYLSLKFLPIILDMIVPYHNYHHIDIIEKGFESEDLPQRVQLVSGHKMLPMPLLLKLWYHREL